MGLLNDEIAIVYISRRGRVVAEKLADLIGTTRTIDLKGDFMNRVSQVWQSSKAIICVMATGIVVRAIAPLLKDKFTDPCIVVVDESAKFSVSLLSGHIGGGNQLTETVANHLGCTPVITTASDNLGLTALDLWLKNNHLLTGQRDLLIKKSARLNRVGKLTCYIDMFCSGRLPDDIIGKEFTACPDIVLTHDMRIVDGLNSTLVANPQTLILGVGCNRNTPAEEIQQCFDELISEARLKQEWFAGIATIDLKINEKGLIEFARELGMHISFFSKDKLNSVENVEYSEAVMKATGAKGVAEPSSILLASDRQHPGSLLIKKQKWTNVTMAVSRKILRLK